MLKQISFLFLVIICILACGRSTKKEMIVGNWGIFVSDNEYCNACPAINFKQDQTGIIKRSDSSILGGLNWTIDDNKLKIYGADEKTHSFIPEGIYSVEFATFKDYKELRLKEINRGFDYTLRCH